MQMWCCGVQTGLPFPCYTVQPSPYSRLRVRVRLVLTAPDDVVHGARRKSRHEEMRDEGECGHHRYFAGKALFDILPLGGRRCGR